MCLSVTCIYDVVASIGKTSLHLSQWCVLQAFIHATMWHNTEPSTLGICYWASVVLLCCLCGPGVVYVICSTSFNTSKCLPRLRTEIIEAIYHFVLRMTPILTLVISALPIMDEVPQVRTLTLGLGMVAIACYVIAIGWKIEKTSQHNDNFTEVNGNIPNEESRRRKISQISSSKCSKNVFKYRTKTHQTDLTRIVGTEVIISILACMGIRWCATSVNIFAENIISSSVLAVVVLLYSVFVAVFKPFSYPRNRERKPDHTLNTTKESELFSGINLHENHKQVSPTPSSKNDTIISIESKYATMPSTCEDDSLLPNNIVRKANTLQPECTSSLFSEETPSNSPFYNRKPTAKTWSRTIFTWLYALFLGSSVGSICAMCLWMFTSPALLCRWSELDLDIHGACLTAAFACGCLIANFLVTGNVFCDKMHSYHKTIKKGNLKMKVSSP